MDKEKNKDCQNIENNCKDIDWDWGGIIALAVIASIFSDDGFDFGGCTTPSETK